mmetsp:Transcript_32761/g.78345  ORF Transcript_32761/g.78345 Transcript_32761/m.78345 type:complete len:227 (+) Transcript_32761:922-1602(+)
MDDGVGACGTGKRRHQDMMRWIRDTQSLHGPVQGSGTALHRTCCGAAANAGQVLLELLHIRPFNTDPTRCQSPAAVAFCIGPNEWLVHSQFLPGANGSPRDDGLVLLLGGFQRHVNVGIPHLDNAATDVGVPMRVCCITSIREASVSSALFQDLHTEVVELLHVLDEVGLLLRRNFNNSRIMRREKVCSDETIHGILVPTQVDPKWRLFACGGYKLKLWHGTFTIL